MNKQRQKHSQFFLYLPAGGGKKWIDDVKEEARADGTNPSTFIRDATTIFLDRRWRKKLIRAAKRRNMSILGYVQEAVRDAIRRDSTERNSNAST